MHLPHNRTPRLVVEDLCRSWAADNFDATFELLAETAEFLVFASPEGLASAGSWHGRKAIRDALMRLRAVLRYKLYRTTITGVSGNIVRVAVEFMGEHIESGETIWIRFRQVFEVHDGLVTRIHEYHDAAMLEAFMRMVELKPHAG